jgi:hypothetical protein
MSIVWNPVEGRWEGEHDEWKRPLTDIPTPSFAPGDVIRDSPSTRPSYQVFVTKVMFDPWSYDFHVKHSWGEITLRDAIRYYGTLAFAHSGEIGEYYVRKNNGGLVPPEEVEPRHVVRQRLWRNAKYREEMERSVATPR